MTESCEFTFPVIGVLHSCFKEKFGVPRQPGLVTGDEARLELCAPYNDPAALEGLERGSHLWLLFVFHLNRRQQWKPKVKPPRLGGNKQMGVFATRSPVRPSPIGMSAVKLIAIDGSTLIVSGADLVDGTPIIDIKPYIPYSDCLPEATNSFAAEAPIPVEVCFSEQAQAVCERDEHPNLRAIISQTLCLDPRPQYQKGDMERVYGVRIYDKNIRWRCDQYGVYVVEITDY